MKTRIHSILVAGAGWGVACFTPNLSAQTTLYSDNFETDTSANWTVLGADSGSNNDYNAFFAFLYTTNRFVRNGITNTIPPAPNSGGVTPNRGVKMYVNKNDAIAAIAAINAYPTGQVFSNDYAVRFDMWLNYNGGAGGGSGSTEFGIFGINHLGDKVNWQNDTSPSDGAWFGVTGEGGAAYDYRSFLGDGSSPAWRWPTRAPGAFLDRDGDGVIEEEIIFGSNPPNWPLELMFPAPTFETPGVPGKQWVQVEIRQRTNDAGGIVVTWKMNEYVICERADAGIYGFTAGTPRLATWTFSRPSPIRRRIISSSLTISGWSTFRACPRCRW